MTQVVTVHTDFTDLNQMTQGLVGRVNDSHVILPAQEPVEVGEWVQFAVTLHDGSPAFAGVGRCVTFVDNGEERLPHQRFDVVFDSLRFDSRAEQIYQHILSLSGIDVPAVEAANDTGSFVDVADVSMASSVPAPPVEEEGESTVVAGTEELREALSRSAVHSVDADYADELGALDREQDEDQGATNPPPAAYTNGARPQPNGALFSYPQGLPFPSAPPRPSLEPSLRVTPAPRPN